jgi:hypothetical protein
MMRYDWTNSSKVIKAQVNTAQDDFAKFIGEELA